MGGCNIGGHSAKRSGRDERVRRQQTRNIEETRRLGSAHLVYNENKVITTQVGKGERSHMDVSRIEAKDEVWRSEQGRNAESGGGRWVVCRGEVNEGDAGGAAAPRSPIVVNGQSF